MPVHLRILGIAAALTAVPALAWAQGQPREPAADSTARVRGTVVDRETRAPVVAATIVFAAEPGSGVDVEPRLTDDRGRFLFPAVPPGTYRIEISRIGYQTLRDTLPIDPHSDIRILAEMSVSAVEMEPLLVVARRWPRGAMAEFEERRRTGLGTYITRELIEARNPIYVTDLLRTARGVHVVPVGAGGYDVRLRGGCRPDLWIDGLLTIPGLPIDQFLMPQDVEAIEIYRGPETPPRFGNNPCGAIVVWTRLPDPEPSRGSFWRRLAIAVGFLTLGFFLAR